MEATHEPIEGIAGRRRNFLFRMVPLLVILAAGSVVFYKQQKKVQARDDVYHSNLESAQFRINTEVLKLTPAQKRARLLEFMNSENSGVRYAALDNLQDINEPDLANILDTAFKDSSSMVRERALELFPTVDPVKAEHLTVAALQDQDSWVRRSAVTILHMGAARKTLPDRKSIVPYLMNALSDTDYSVPYIAAHVLAEITGNHWELLRRMPAPQQQKILSKWRGWWATNQKSWPVDSSYRNIGRIDPVRADPAPDFGLHDLDGHSINLDSEKGHVVLLTFWLPYSGFCKADAEALQRVYKELSDKGVRVVGVALPLIKTADQARHWAEIYETKFPQCLANEDILSDFGSVDEPVTLLIDAAGKLRYRWDGDRDYETFHGAVDRVLAEKIN